jgi:hypothetical protein
MLLEAETNKYCPGGNEFGAISNLITWVLNFFLSVCAENAGDVRARKRAKCDILRICMRVVLLDRPLKSHQPLYVFLFFNFS